MGKRGPQKGRPIPHFVILAARQHAASEAQVLEAVAKSSSLGLRQLARQTGLAVDTVKRAVARLEARGEVQIHRNVGTWAATLPGGNPRLPLTAEQAALVKTVKQFGPVSQLHIIARHRDVPRTTVQHRLSKLVKRGQLTMERVGPQVEYALARDVA